MLPEGHCDVPQCSGPRGQKRHADEGERQTMQTIALHDMLDSFAFRGAKRARLVPFPGALNLGPAAQCQRQRMH